VDQNLGDSNLEDLGDRACDSLSSELDGRKSHSGPTIYIYIYKC
jgi:hypothetical protein